MRLNHIYIATEHLLLGLVAELGGIAAQLLDSLSVSRDLDDLRHEVEAVLGRGTSATHQYVELTEHVRSVLTMAGDEAHRRGSAQTDTAHLWFGLVRYSDIEPFPMLHYFGRTRDQLHDHIIELVNRDAQTPDADASLPPSVQPGQKMRITEGPFKGFAGTITAANPGRRQVRVEIALAGRRNDIDLDILHVTPW